jgi:hypothetical protein
MQLGVIVLAIAIAVGYGAVFSFVYPLVQEDASLVALFTFLGLLTALPIAGAWKAVTKNRIAR